MSVNVEDKKLNGAGLGTVWGLVKQHVAAHEVTEVRVGEAGYNPSSGVVSLPAYPSTPSDVGLNKVGNFKAVSTESGQGLNTVEQSNARTNIGAGTSNFGGSYIDLTDKPEIPYVGTASVDTCIGIIDELL